MFVNMPELNCKEEGDADACTQRIHARSARTHVAHTRMQRTYMQALLLSSKEHPHAKAAREKRERMAQYIPVQYDKAQYVPIVPERGTWL